jgi:DNA-binding PadR family transcriptional regulator
MFEQGALKLLVLHLLSERPCHGYEIIKAIEQLVGGDYSPSPGVVYPTLSFLADLDLVTVNEQAGGRKQYAITPAGQSQLETQQGEIQNLLSRLSATRQESSARSAPEIQRAMSNLKMAIHMRFAQGVPDKALLQQVAALIDQAAVGIERL